MMRLRRALGLLAGAWLFCQVATVTTVPLLFWVHSPDALLACTCPEGAESTCPMHHQTPPESKHCLMRSINDAGAIALSSLLGPVGLMPARTPATVLVLAGTPAFATNAVATPSPVPPDPPPPRA